MDGFINILLPILTCMTSDILNHITFHVWDVVLMDVLMPGKNGFEIAKEMRAFRPDQKIVMVTGLGCQSKMDQTAAGELQCDNYLSKPFSFEKVRRVIDGVEENNIINGYYS